MKKHIFIALALLFFVGGGDVTAQNFLKKLEKTVKKEVTKKVEEKVNKGIDKLTGKDGQSQSQSQQQSQSGSQVSQSKNTKGIVPTVVQTQTNNAPMSGKTNGHEWVDLGLPSGVRWATCNVDATQPAQPGKLYAWGEITTKASYTPENGKHYKKDADDFSGDKANDVATAKWGKGWRMPTKADFDELLHYCGWKYVQKGGRWGAEITSPFNDKSIFLPVTGYKDGSKHEDAGGNGMYWTATPYKDQYNNGAHEYHFGGALGEMGVSERSYGYAIRAVADNDALITTPSQGETNGHRWVDLGLPSGTKWATCNIGAATSENHGEYFKWGEITPIWDKTSSKNKVRGKWMSGIGGSTTYDAAAALWGKGWKMPTKADFQELMEHCTWEWTSLGRIKGCKVTSKINGNYIFLPASGNISSVSVYAFPSGLNNSTAYWASTPSKDEHNIFADAFSISEKSVCTSIIDRKDGFPIRPVTK